jgi:predicted small metal-binding protein
MPQLACRDLGMECNAVINGSSVEEVKRRAMQHAQAVHADMLKTMSTPEQMAQMDKLMESKIR